MTGGTVQVLDITLKIQRVSVSQSPQHQKSQVSQRSGLVLSGERINIQCLLSFGKYPTYSSFDACTFLRRLFNSFASEEFRKCISLLQEELNGMDLPLLPSLVDVPVVQSGLIQSGLIHEISDCMEVS